MMNFNTAESQNSYELIPANTIAKACLVLKGGNDPTNQWVTIGKNAESSYLNCEFIILEGLYAKRKIFDKIGIGGSDIWVNIANSRSGGANGGTHETRGERKAVNAFLRELDIWTCSNSSDS